VIKRAWFRPLAHRPALGGFLAVVALAVAIFAGSADYGGSVLPRTIIVQPGDTLWGIATANGLSVAQLAAANGMSPNDILLIGRHLVIPATSPTPAAAAAAGPAGAGGEATFCADTSFYKGPWGQLPSQLTADPSRLALRPTMVSWAQTYGLDPALVEAVAWQESGWQQGVVSGSGAVGIGQLLPSTASFVDNDLVGARLNLNVASDNVQMEAAFLAYLVHQVGANACMVAAAYYQGPAALRSYGVFPETEQYVRDVLALEPEFE
jgi:murein DD-endopeptidase MepM/ murein hydrolase activator NlpD